MNQSLISGYGPGVTNGLGAGFSLCCLKVQAKGNNDAAFLDSAKKLLQFSWGVLVLLILTAIGFLCWTMYEVGFEDFTREFNFIGNRYADDYLWETLKGDFVGVTCLGLFMSLPMLFPCCITPTCAYCASKHQDHGMLSFVVCQHGTGAIGGTMCIIYGIYKIVSSVSDSDVSAGDAAHAASEGVSYMSTEEKAYAGGFVAWCCILLTLHWCAFCKGISAKSALSTVGTSVQMPMSPV